VGLAGIPFPAPDRDIDVTLGQARLLARVAPLLRGNQDSSTATKGIKERDCPLRQSLSHRHHRDGLPRWMHGQLVQTAARIEFTHP